MPWLVPQLVLVRRNSRGFVKGISWNEFLQEEPGKWLRMCCEHAVGADSGSLIK